MALSSINFQKVSVHSFKHNDRTENKTAKTVFTDLSHKNIFDTSSDRAKKTLDYLFKTSISKVTGRTRKAAKKNVLVEAVVNIKSNTTLEDLKKLQKHIEKEFGFTGLQIAIHRDEGHYEDDKFITNEHAHMSFFTLDRETGRQMFRREHINKDKLRDLQTKTAELLVMDRGTDKRVSKRERLNHKDYKQAKRLELAKQKDLKQEITKLRTELKENSATREDYAELEALNRELKEKIKQKELSSEQLLKEVEHFKSLVLVKEIEIEDTQNQNKTLQEQKKTLDDKLLKLEEKINSRANMSAEYDEIQQKFTTYKNNSIKIFREELKIDKKEKLSWSLVKEKIKSLFEKITSLTKEVTSLKDEVSDLKSENQNLLKENLSLKNEINSREQDELAKLISEHSQDEEQIISTELDR